MALRKHFNRHMKTFLRKLRMHPQALPLADWPRATTLRRWMRRQGFREALTELMAVYRLQSDWITAATSVRAAKMVETMISLSDGDEINPRDLAFFTPQVELLSRLVRMDHLRQKAQAKATTVATSAKARATNRPPQSKAA